MDIWRGSSRFERESLLWEEFEFGVNGTGRELFEDTVMERFVIIWEKLRGGRAEWVGVWLPYEWPRLKRFEINAVLNIMVYRSRYCRRGGGSMIY